MTAFTAGGAAEATRAVFDDAAPGGVALHALRPSETAEVLALVEQWGPTDRSFGKLAHRGCYEGRCGCRPRR